MRFFLPIRKVLRLIGPIVLLGLFLAGLRSRSVGPAGPFPGQSAPAFHLTGSGGGLSSTALLGRPVVLNFWASWCPSCRAEWPALQALARSGVRVVAVDDGRVDSPDAVARFLRTAGRGVPVYIDPAGQLADRYLVRSLPTTFFLTAQGVISSQVVGAEDLDSFRQNLSRTAFHRSPGMVTGGLFIPILWPVPGLSLLLFTGLAGILLAEFLVSRLAARSSVPVAVAKGLLEALLLGAFVGGKLPGMINGIRTTGLWVLWREAAWSWPGALFGAALAYGLLQRKIPEPRTWPGILIPALLAGSGLAVSGAGYFWPAATGWHFGSGYYQPFSLYLGLGLLLAGLLGARGRLRVAMALAAGWVLLLGALWPGSVGAVPAMAVLSLGLLASGSWPGRWLTGGFPRD